MIWQTHAEQRRKSSVSAVNSRSWRVWQILSAAGVSSVQSHARPLNRNRRRGSIESIKNGRHGIGMMIPWQTQVSN